MLRSEVAGRPILVEHIIVGCLEMCLRRPIGVSLLMLALLLSGALAFLFLPVASLPRVDYPTIMVTAALPGAEPQTMATAGAAPPGRPGGRSRRGPGPPPPD